MAYIPLEKLIREKTSLFKLVLTAAGRANELAGGARPVIQTNSKKISTIALLEIAEGMVTYEETKPGKGK